MAFPSTITLNAGSPYTGPLDLSTSLSTSTSKIYGVGSDSSSWSATIEFRHESDGSTKVYVNPSVQGGTDVPDQVKINNGTAVASAVIANGKTVSTWRSLTGSAAFVFDVNTSGTNNLIFSGGGTTSSGSTTPAGTIQKSGNTLIFKVLSTSPSASGVIAYQLFHNDVLTSVDFTGHVNGTTTSRTATAVDGTWRLKMLSNTGLYQTGNLDTLVVGATQRKKVFCNFW